MSFISDCDSTSRQLCLLEKLFLFWHISCNSIIISSYYQIVLHVKMSLVCLMIIVYMYIYISCLYHVHNNCFIYYFFYYFVIDFKTCFVECEAWHFGTNCNKMCYCRNTTCNIFTGECSIGGCKKGWGGDSCDQGKNKLWSCLLNFIKSYMSYKTSMSEAFFVNVLL